MGYGQRPSRGARDLGRIEALCAAHLGSIHPIGLYRFVPHPFGAQVFPDCERLALGLVTIGPELEARAAVLSRQGRLFDALVLDALGSAAVEAASQALEDEILAVLCQQGLSATSRKSPGYGAFDLECQRIIFSLLPAAELGVTLSSGLMMAPQKSISFTMGVLGEAEGEQRPGCAGCERRGCKFRRAAPLP
jgi:hypothetical protein